MRQIRVTQYGGPEQMRLVELPDPVPAPGEALVRVTVAGVNCMDIAVPCHCPAGLPAAMGVVGAGSVEAIGAGVENLAPGDRVAWFYHPGSYATSPRSGPIPSSRSSRWSTTRPLPR